MTSKTTQIEANITRTKTVEAVVHERHGISAIGSGEFVQAKEAMWPPIDTPAKPTGQ